MAEFAEVNVDGRLRKSVRGRVIVFTTSLVVEFLDKDLQQTIPLYSQLSYPDGFGLCFLVELNGFLTFDKDCFVKISEEFSPFREVYYNPAAWSLVKPPSEVGTITAVAVGDTRPSATMPTPELLSVLVTVSQNGKSTVYSLEPKVAIIGGIFVQDLVILESLGLKAGAVWLGVNGYKTYDGTPMLGPYDSAHPQPGPYEVHA